MTDSSDVAKLRACRCPGNFTEREFFTIPDALWTYDQGGQPSVGMSGGDTIPTGSSPALRVPASTSAP